MIASEVGADSVTAGRNLRLGRSLPLTILALGAAIALAAAPAVGAAGPWPRLATQLGLVTALAVWLVWRMGRPLTRSAYVVRSAGAFVLTVLNPLFCIFAWIGYTDADDVFAGRAVWAAVAATAVTMSMGQSGGIPSSEGQALLFVGLLGVNFGIAYVVGSHVFKENQISDDRLVALVELERVNDSLRKALDENAALHEAVIAQAREVGIQEERQRLAREIHDTLAQSLAGIIAQLQAVGDDSDADDVRRRIDWSAALARTALREARRSVMDLAPAALSGRTLRDAVQAEVDEWTNHNDARVDVVVTGYVRALHPEVEAALLRIAQEALSNVAGHADATRVGVTLTYLDGEVALDVRDDGSGFDRLAPARAGAFGLRGMRQRAERLAGILEVESRPGSGTAVCVRLPAIEAGPA